MPKYKVSFSGFAYVEADTAEDAREVYEFDYAYMEETVTSCEEVEEFVVVL